MSTPGLNDEMTGTANNRLNQPSPAGIISQNPSGLFKQIQPRPKLRRIRTSRRYYTPPSSPSQSPSRPSSRRTRSPVRDLALVVETGPQDPDIFEDDDSDYFSSFELLNNPSSSRREIHGSSIPLVPVPTSVTMAERGLECRRPDLRLGNVSESESGSGEST